MEIDEVDKILRAKTPHDVLGVDVYFMFQADSTEKLTKLYRRLSFKVHPDRNHDVNATKAFQRLSSAYEQLLKKPIVSTVYRDVKKQSTKPEEKAERKQEMPPKETIYCKATTESDTACKNRATTGEQYCHSHRNFDPHKPKKVVVEKVNCRAKCKDDSPCSKSATEGSLYCSLHINYDPNKPKIVPKVKVPCAATTKANQPCSKSADGDSVYCKIHKPFKP